MRPRALRTRRDRPSGDEGFALITTVLVMALLAAFSLVVLQQTLSSTTLSKKDQDWVAALSAAQAGVDDYLSRINDTGGGYSRWSTTNPDPSNPAMGFTGTAANWAPMQTAAGEASRGSFHYDVSTTGFTGSSTVAPNGNIVVSSTGRVGARSRTITATVRRSGFVDYVYFTDLETQDPVTYAEAYRDAAVASCTTYYGTRHSGCTDIAFADDTLNGPVHTNDTMLVCGGVSFKDSVTTGSGPVAANANKPYRVDGCASTTGTTFLRPDDPLPVKRIDLPGTNLGLKAETQPVVPAAPRGCLYVGPTKIVVKGTQLRVTSPWTKTVTPGCAKDTFFTIPVNGVVYVDVVPAEGTSDPNSWGAAEAGKPTCPTTGNNVGYPIASETDWNYPCKAGDVFIEQLGGDTANALQGRLTVSANNNLYITNHLEYAGGTGGNSFLGLIADNFVYVWHPVSGNSNLNLPGQTTPFLDARIHAAMLSVTHAITVQHYGTGPALGTLNVTGALIQKYRGIVRGTSSGYAKNYIYDQRLRYDAPPKFLNPTISSFGAVRTAEAKPQYR